jgi:predicted Ser/Thr protein kinase
MGNGLNKRFGRYEILAELGRGAMGIVYKAHDPQIGRIVALKTVSLTGEEPEEEEEFRQRFLSEARAAGRLQHPGLVAIYDAGQDERTRDPYIVLEFVSGRSLSQILAREKKLTLSRALQLAEEIAEALDYAHAQGVVHRDIKPANVLVTEDGHAKITDFGIAQLNLAHFNVPGRVLGTPAYMAPEQLSGEGVDNRSDIFSLGVLLYAMVTGHSPFHGNSATTVCHKVINRDPVPASAFHLELPRALDAVILRAMAKDPSDRYQRGSDFAEALRNLRSAPATGQLSPTLAALANANVKSIQFADPLRNVGQAPRTARTAQVPAKQLLVAAAVAVLLLAIAVPIRQLMKFQGRGQSASLPPADGEPTPGRPRDAVVAAMDTDKSSEATSAPPEVPKVKAKPRRIAKAATPNPVVAAAPPVAAALSDVAPTSTLELAIEHEFKEATLYVWVDDQLSLTRSLYGGSYRKLVVLKGTRGVDSESLQVHPGTHLVKVRAQTSDQTIDLSKTISADFAPGGDRTLHVSFERHNSAMRLAWQ